VSLRIGTRASALALAQARLVADALGEGEIVEVSTRGDRGAAAGDKSRWVGELEAALAGGEVDVAVHSAKDVPGELGAGLEIAAVPARADARDAVCGAAGLDALGAGARVGTSSLRRRALLLADRPDLEVVEMRGNVDTRLGKLADGDYDAIVLARAGLERLGRTGEAGDTLPAETFVPAPGQGALALETRAGDDATRAALSVLDDPRAHACLRAERALCAAIGASCHTPVGAWASIEGETMALTAFAGHPDGSAWARDRLEGPAGDPDALGQAVGARLLGAGAAEILAHAEARAAGAETR